MSSCSTLLATAEVPSGWHSFMQSPVIDRRIHPSMNRINSDIADYEVINDRVQWQSADDLPERRLMVQRIMIMTKHNGRINVSQVEWAEKTPDIARRVELSLYSRAASLEEYKDLTTLKRRLQSLVALSYHEAAAASIVETKRKRTLDHSYSFESARKVVKLASTQKQFFIENEDILGHIYSFLNISEILKHRTINHYCNVVLPACVSYVRISCQTLNKGFQQHGVQLLLKFPNIKRFQLFTRNPIKHTKNSNDRNALHAWGCIELDIAHSNIGEQLVGQLASAIELGALSHIEQLGLLSVFTNTSRINGIRSLCRALAAGNCTHLSDLLLGGNSISDAGMCYLSNLLKSKKLPKLERLDLRRNYIGEAGILSITQALSYGRCPTLKYLCLGGNIITDKSVEPVTKMLSKSSCPQMRFLGLEDNFISSEGVQRIIDAAVVGGMMPKLHKICHPNTKDCSCKSNPGQCDSK